MKPNALDQTRYPDSPNPNSVNDGMEFQDFVMDQLRIQKGWFIQVYTSAARQLNQGESAQSAEIKLDSRCTETGRLSIEIYEKTRADRFDWTASGILLNPPPTLYIQGNKTCFWVFHTKDLRQYYAGLIRGRDDKIVTIPTIKTFYIPIVQANSLAMFQVRNTEGQYKLFNWH